MELVNKRYCKWNKFRLINCVLLLCLTFFSWFYTRDLLMFMSNKTQIGVCTSDLIINNYSEWRNGYISYVFIMIDILFLVRNDFRYSNLIVHGSRRKLWNRQVKKILTHATIYAAYYGSCTLLFSFGYGLVNMNWNDYESYFFMLTKMVMSVEFTFVVISFFLAFTIFWITIGFEYLLFHWLWHNEIFVWIMIFFVRFVVRKWLKINAIISLGFNQWMNHRILQGFAITGILIIALYVAGSSCVKKREFLSERK